MKHVKLKITALQGLHTGSDNQNTGNFKMQARRPYIVKRPKIESNFKSDEARRRAAVEVCLSLWESIPSDVRLERKSSINEEFFSALSFASFAPSKAAFLQIFGAKFGIRNMDFSDEAMVAFECFGDIEFLECVRNETQLIQIMLKSRRIDKKTKTKSASLFDVEKDIKEEDQAEEQAAKVPSEQLYEVGKIFVPVLSANQFRHKLRELAMEYFFEFIGKSSMSQQAYYEYFSGGSLHSSEGKINLKTYNEMIRLCPPLALFGTAKGDRMIEGMLMVSDLVPRCLELGTGQISHYELLNAVFGTRKDAMKDERRIEVVEDPKSKAGPQQMLYYTESLIPGTEMDCLVRLQKLDQEEHFQIVASCLAHTLQLVAESQVVGAKAAVAHGQARIEQIENTLGVGPELYLNWLAENRNEIKEGLKYE